MELFKITCVTCQARLTVRDSSLIGQIVACPRCQSMVEVRSPAQEPTPEPEAPSTPEPEDTSTPEPVATEGIPPNAELSWFAKYQLLIGALASVAVGATLLALVFLRGGDEPQDADSLAKADKTDPIKQEPLPDAVTPQELIPTQEVATEVAATEEPSPLPEPPIKTQEIASKVEDPTMQQPVATEEQPKQTPKLARLPKLEEPPAKRSFNALDLDPENLDLASISKVHKPAPLPRAKRRTVFEPQEEALDIPPQATVVRLSPDSLTSPLEIDLEASLKQVYPNLKFNDLPLIHFLRLVSELSGVPVGVSPEHLTMAGISARRPVSLKAEGLDLQTILEKVLSPLNLEHRLEERQICIVRRDSSRFREISYPMGDLTTEQTDAETLKQWVTQLVAPDTWSDRGGSGTIHIENGVLRVSQAQRVHYQILILLERLRLARHLPQESRFPIVKLFPESPQQLVDERLKRTTTFTFSRYTSLREVFSFWEAELRLPILVDWPALSEKQLWPQTEITCNMSDEPWHSALDKVLAPLGLGWRIVPGKSIQITSSEIINTKPELEFFPLESGFDTREQQLRSSSHPQAVLLYDPVGKVLMSRQPASAQRRLAKQLLGE